MAVRRRGGNVSMAQQRATSPGTEKPRLRRAGEGGIKETLESIVVAFILAFIFRAFVVEAFRIPTGSMATSLLGAHTTRVCERCGYHFTTGVQEVKGAEDLFVCCPNCRHSQMLRPVGVAGRRLRTRSGDRILVLKLPYDIGGAWLGPRRWDVVVFKYPGDAQQINYIKRLVGLPDEVVELIDGDLYRADAAAVPPTVLEKLAAGRSYMDLDEDERRALDAALMLTPKTAAAQETLWSVVYDHDFLPDHQIGTIPAPRWAPRRAGSGWDASQEEIRFEPKTDELAEVELVNCEFIDDHGYNYRHDPRREGDVGQGFPQLIDHDRVVSDLRLSLLLMGGARPGGGVLQMQLSKQAEVFTARIAADGGLTLLHDGPGNTTGRREVGLGRIAAVAAGEPVHLAIQNVDHRVSVWADGTMLLLHDDWRADPAVVRERANGQPPPTVRIGAAAWPVRLRHVLVERDVYYRNPSRQRLEPRPGFAAKAWPFYLRDGEYFMLGDNSAASKDSRLWNEHGDFLNDPRRGVVYHDGTVPADQLIGRAFFVYWPSGLPAFGANAGPRVVPNVGQMRFVR